VTSFQAGLSSSDFSAASAGVGLIRNCSAALVPVLADKMEQLFQCVVMPTYAMSESGSDRKWVLLIVVRFCLRLSLQSGAYKK
jgi:hypothetical protein